MMTVTVSSTAGPLEAKVHRCEGSERVHLEIYIGGRWVSEIDIFRTSLAEVYALGQAIVTACQKLQPPDDGAEERMAAAVELLDGLAADQRANARAGK